MTGKLRYYIETAPRPYDIVILFATKKSETCDQVYIEYQTVATHFKEKKSHFTSKEGGKLKRPVFFATVYHSSDTSKIFRDVITDNQTTNRAGGRGYSSPAQIFIGFFLKEY